MSLVLHKWWCVKRRSRRMKSSSLAESLMSVAVVVTCVSIPNYSRPHSCIQCHRARRPRAFWRRSYSKSFGYFSTPISCRESFSVLCRTLAGKLEDAFIDKVGGMSCSEKHWKLRVIMPNDAAQGLHQRQSLLDSHLDSLECWYSRSSCPACVHHFTSGWCERDQTGPLDVSSLWT